MLSRVPQKQMRCLASQDLETACWDTSTDVPTSQSLSASSAAGRRRLLPKRNNSEHTGERAPPDLQQGKAFRKDRPSRCPDSSGERLANSTLFSTGGTACESTNPHAVCDVSWERLTRCQAAVLAFVSKVTAVLQVVFQRVPKDRALVPVNGTKDFTPLRTFPLLTSPRQAAEAARGPTRAQALDLVSLRPQPSWDSRGLQPS